jgi:DNA-binding FrmR family transcriptional regulator
MDGGSYNKDDLIKRLKRIEGQIRGLQRMIDEDKYCVDILTQVASAEAALHKVGILILEKHTKSCVVRAVQEGNADEKIEELIDILTRFGR